MFHRVGVVRPCALEAAGDRGIAVAAAEGIAPTEVLLFDAGAGRRKADILSRIGGAVRLAEGVAAGDQRDRFLVVHRHAAERLANIARCGKWIGLAVRTFRIHIDQTHLHGRERLFEVVFAAVALVLEPCIFRAPVDVFVGLPRIDAAAARIRTS